MKLEKVQGVKSVDMRIVSVGHGVINWNGSPELFSGNPQKNYGKIENHKTPKIRGMTPFSGEVTENGFRRRLKPEEIVISDDNPMYVSGNCYRYHIFKDFVNDHHELKLADATKLLTSVLGLLRGHVITEKRSDSVKRTSPLLVLDGIEQKHNYNFEQFGKSGSKATSEDKKSTSIFSATTFGDTEYHTYASINIENLQLIVLDKIFDNCAAIVTEAQGKQLAKDIAAYLKDISTDDSLDPVCTYGLYARNGSVFNHKQQAILLNDDAIQVVVDWLMNRLQNLDIAQGGGYMKTSEITVDYNDGQMFRIRESLMSANPEKPSNGYAVYFSE